MTSTWRGTTAEERIAPRREKLLRAGFELLGDHGEAGTTVRGVCARASLNPRYFYESFDDLDTLLVAVFDSIMAETTSLTLEAIAAAENTAEAKTAAALGAAIRHLAADPRRIRIVLGEAGGRSLARRRAAAIARTAELMAGQAAVFYGMPRDDRLLLSTTYMLAGGLSALVIAWHDGRIELTVDELVANATALVVGTSRATGRLTR